jgi:hypothetical protein
MWASLRGAWRSVMSKTNVIIVSVVGAVFACAIHYVPPPPVSAKPALTDDLLGLYLLLYLVLFVVWLVAGVVCLLRGRFRQALRYAAAAAIFYVGLNFPGEINSGENDEQHARMAELYSQGRDRLMASAQTSQPSAPRLVPFDERCDPPKWCSCWIVLDPDHTSGVEADLGYWHQPRSSFFPPDVPPFGSARIDVRHIDADTYSVLACSTYPGLG